LTVVAFGPSRHGCVIASNRTWSLSSKSLSTHYSLITPPFNVAQYEVVSDVVKLKSVLR